jgi:hypothetical protein
MRKAGKHRSSVSAEGKYERGAQYLLDAITTACEGEGEADFPARVEAALRATLVLFAAEPELARLLVIRPYESSEEDIRCYQQGLKRFGALLRSSAACDPRASVQPDFLEPALIGGIVWQITRRLLGCEAGSLEELLPSMLEFVLVFYFDPKEAGRFAGAGSGVERMA